MTEDAPLSDFIEERDDTPEESEPEPNAVDEDVAEAGDDSLEQTPSNVDPAVTTYGWGTYVCGACESSVERVWRRESHLVCEECAEW